MWLERLVRFGCATKGFIYFIIGLLSLQVAFGISRQTTDTKGALEAIAVQPFGKFLLSAVTIGLISYAFWRLVEAVIDPEHSTQDPTRIFPRIGYAMSGLSYASLAFSATELLLGFYRQENDLKKDLTAKLLIQPFGQWLVGILGAVIIGMGVFYLYRACHLRFREQFNLRRISNPGFIWAMHLGRLGIAARGLVFCLIGFFFIQAAWHFDPNKARGLDEILRAIAFQPQGKFCLIIVGIGLIAYSIHMLVEARYRRLTWLQEMVQTEQD